MENKEYVSYLAFEGEMTRLERTNHRMFILCLALLVALLLTNLGWIVYESQREYYTETVQEVNQEANNGTNNFIGGDYNGEAEGQNND